MDEITGDGRGSAACSWNSWHGCSKQPCPSYECHLTHGAVFGLSNRNFLTIWLRWSKSQNLIMCSDEVNIFKISNVTALTARPLPIVKLRSRSRSRSGEGQKGQIWTWAVPYFWFSPEYLGEILKLKLLSETKREERQGRYRISVGLGCFLWLCCWDPVLIQHGRL